MKGARKDLAAVPVTRSLRKRPFDANAILSPKTRGMRKNRQLCCRPGGILSGRGDDLTSQSVGFARRLRNWAKTFSLSVSRRRLPLMSELTHILSAIEQGDARAAEQLLPLVYEELRQLA